MPLMVNHPKSCTAEQVIAAAKKLYQEDGVEIKNALDKGDDWILLSDDADNCTVFFDGKEFSFVRFGTGQERH